MVHQSLTAVARWADGKRQFVGESGTGHAIVMDIGKDDGGHDSGMRPMELLLLGQAGCTGLDVVYILEKMRKTVTGLEVSVEGFRRDEHPRVYTRIDVLFRARGKGLTAADLQKAIRLSETTYCSASATLAKTAEIHARYELTDDVTGETVSGEVGADA